MGVDANGRVTSSCYHRPYCAQWGCLGEGPEQSEVAQSRWGGLAWVKLLRHSFRRSSCSAPFLAGPAPCSVGPGLPLHRTAQAQRAGVGFEAMAPGQRLVLCEETVRERSGLGPHRDLGACGDDSWGSGCPPGGLPGLLSRPQCACRFAENGLGRVVGGGLWERARLSLRAWGPGLCVYV